MVLIARPTTTAEALKPAPTLKLQEVAKCSSTGGRPAPRIHWLSNLNGSIHETREPGPQRGTYTVTSIFSLVPSSQADGKNITCRVDHESLLGPDLQTVTLSLPCKCLRMRTKRQLPLSPLLSILSSSQSAPAPQTTSSGSCHCFCFMAPLTFSTLVF